MWTSVKELLPDRDKDVLFVRKGISKCHHTGQHLGPTVHYGFMDYHGIFRSYIDVTDKWKPTHWMYTDSLLKYLPESKILTDGDSTAT